MPKKLAKDTDGSTRFHKVGEVEFWLTPMNCVFLVIGPRQVFPSLQGTVVRFDDPNFRPDHQVMEDLRRILRKQREIRQGWPTIEEDENAFTCYG